MASAALPTAWLTGISSGQTVSGTVALGASATGDGGVRQLKWYVDGVEVGWDGSSPWQFNWNSASVADGAHTAYATAADAYGTWGMSQVVSFYVANNARAGQGISVTWPTAGATVSGTFNLTAVDALASQVKWYVDGREVGWDGSAPWLAAWNSAGVSNGSHSITARALRNGTWTESAQVWFTVQNGGGGTPPPPPPPPPPSSKWRLAVSEDFNGSAVDTSKWRVYGPNWSGHAGSGLRAGRAVGVANGLLTITARMIDGVLVSGGVKSLYSQRYGRYEFRVRTDADPSGGTNSTVLTWPTSGNWPSEGENNIYETNNTSRSPFMSFIHYSAQNRQYYYFHHADATQWHDMAMEWEPHEMRIYRDGQRIATLTDTYAIPDWAHQLVMQLDAQQSWMSGSVRLQVAYMRIYERMY